MKWGRGQRVVLSWNHKYVHSSEKLHTEVGINRTWETVKGNILERISSYIGRMKSPFLGHWPIISIILSLSIFIFSPTNFIIIRTYNACESPPNNISYTQSTHSFPFLTNFSNCNSQITPHQIITCLKSFATTLQSQQNQVKAVEPFNKQIHYSPFLMLMMAITVF